MHNCKNCDFEPFDDDSFCRQCGEEIETFTCECGEEVFKEDNYCHACGAEMSDTVEEEAGSMRQALPPQQPVQPQPMPPQQPIQPQPQQPFNPQNY
ncbi:MAG: zinc ribbon domain-containing protein [Candidatus Nanoarchaeia archaeon]